MKNVWCEKGSIVNINKNVYILILNWNGWADTIECLESVFRIDYPNYRVVVCDNDSGDGSIQNLMAWAVGHLKSCVSESSPLKWLTFPPIPKPIDYILYNRHEAESADRGKKAWPLTLIQTGGNLGFAGGNNVGLRYIQAIGDGDYVWLLNNDTVVKPDSLSWLVKRMEDNPRAGICGSFMPYYHDPNIIWTSGGGVYNRWLAKSRSIDVGKQVYQASSRDYVEKKMFYVAGASMFVTAGFLNDIGLMSEEYFLYFEEPDWSIRGMKNYYLAYAPDSVVYHKVGASTDNKVTMYYIYRSQLLFTKKFFPEAYPIVYLRVIINRCKYRCRQLFKKLYYYIRENSIFNE